MKMMDAKVFAALCALLIINFGSANDVIQRDHGASSTTAGSDGSPSKSLSPSTPGSIGHAITPHHLNDSDTSPGRADNNSLSHAATEEKRNGWVTATPEEDSGSHTVSPSVTAAPESNVAQPSPPSPAAVSNTSTTGIPLANSSTADVSQPDHSDRPNVTETPALSMNASANHKKANSSAEMQPTEPPKMEATTTITTTTTAATVSTTTSSANSPINTNSTTITTTTTMNSTTAQVSATKSASPPPSHSTLQTVGPHQGGTTTRPGITTTQGKGHAASPSQLNVNGEDTKMVPDSPKLDPMLAGLVSAFIIAAVVIILLLFLKLRKRGNQPEFRRLQDLPMDDMEDTPLSMYSY